MMNGTPQERSSIPPFEGFIEGGATFTVPLRKPQELRGELKVDHVQINARASPGPVRRASAGYRPYEHQADHRRSVPKDLRIRSALFSARDTSLEVAGIVPFGAKGSADLTVRGSVNLVIFATPQSGFAGQG